MNQTINSDLDPWYFVLFIPMNFFKLKPFSLFFYLYANDEIDKMMERIQV